MLIIAEYTRDHLFSSEKEPSKHVLNKNMFKCLKGKLKKNLLEIKNPSKHVYRKKNPSKHTCKKKYSDRACSQKKKIRPTKIAPPLPLDD